MPELVSLICRAKSLRNNAKRVGERISSCFTPKGVVSKHIVDLNTSN